MLPTFRQPPPLLPALLRFDGDARSKSFLHKICQYNYLFAFTSMCARVDRVINRPRGPYVCSICGHVHHRIRSLVPCSSAFPRFIELYVYDTDNEIDNRICELDASENTEGGRCRSSHSFGPHGHA